MSTAGFCCEEAHNGHDMRTQFFFVLSRPWHVPAARLGALMEIAVDTAATIGPGPSHHPPGKLLSYLAEGGPAEARKRKCRRYFHKWSQRHAAIISATPRMQ